MTQKSKTDELISVISGFMSGFDSHSLFKRENWTKTWQLALLVAFVGTVAYYLPLVGGTLPGHAHWAGFALTGDQRVGYFPSFVEGYRRFWHGGLLGIDFLVNDGGSIFAYRPNLMPFYPPFLVSYLLADCSNLKTAIVVYTVIHVLHQFLGLFFSFVFVRKYLGFPSASAALAATVFGLTTYGSSFTGEATFYFQMMLLPVAACALCWLMQTRSWLAAIWVSPVFLTVMLSNYGPTMLASLSMAIMAALIAYWMWIDGPEPRRLSALTRPLVSLVLAGLVCLPYFFAQIKYKAIIAPTADDIDPVAHDLALSGHDLINGLSPFMDFHRTHFEEILVWGSLPIFLCIIGLDVLIKRKSAIRVRYLRACGASALIYLLVLLPTFGRGLLPAADAFYYLVPFMGRMHIFQRYLGFAQFFFAIAVSALATIAVVYASANAKRVAAFAGIAIWLGVSVALQIWPLPDATAVSEMLVEVFLMAMGSIALAATTPTAALLVISVLIAVVGLKVAYDIPLATNRIEWWTGEPDPLGAETRSMIDFVKANDGGKALTKIAVASTDIMPYFNRDWPWMVGKEVKLMTYQGYPPHLTNLADYSAHEFGNYGNFDVDWLKETGLDFIFWNDAMAAQLQPFTKAGLQIGPVLTLPGGNHLAKVSTQNPVLLDLSPTTASQWPKPMQLQGWAVDGGRLVKSGNDQAQFGFVASAVPRVSYQVDMDVDAKTAGQLRIAYASQVLGLITTAGPMHFSQRVDATEIGDLWISATPSFTGTLSNVTVKLAPAAGAATEFPATFDNGILRFAGPAGAVTGFATNYTTRIKLDVDAPGTITYLLWPNPYMVPYLDGVRTTWANPGERPLKINVGPGRHRFEVKFRSRPGLLFYWASILYLIGLAASVAGPFALPYIERYRHRSRGA
jgi:hypothetical protein